MRLVALLFVISLNVWTQTQPASLQVTRLHNITSTPSSCTPYSSQCIDNRSTLRQNNYHSFYATGAGTWSVVMQYAANPSGPWTSFGDGAIVTNTSTYPVGFGYGYHEYIRFSISGIAMVTYSGTKDFFPGGAAAGGSGGGGISLLNSLSSSTQTFGTGTTGSDFNIVSATGTHTFNIPSSGAASRGLLTSADWTLFSAKAGAGACNAGSYMTAVSNSAPTCAQVQYSQIGSTPTLYHQNVAVNGADQTQRGKINFIAGTNVTLSPSDDSGNNKLDLTISATAGSGGYVTMQNSGVGITERSVLNIVGAALVATDNAGQSRTDLTLSQSPVGATSVVGTTRSVSTSSPLSGGGDLSANRTLSCPTCVTSSAEMTSGRVITGAGTQGVQASSKTLPTGDIVGTSDTQTLTNKLITGPIINGSQILQASNGGDAIYGKRFQDSGPLGNLIRYQNQAGSADLWTIDVTGTLTAGSVPVARIPDIATFYSTKTAGGDLSGTLPSPTVAKVNGVAYPSAPSTSTIPMVTASNTVTYKAIPNCLDEAGQHLNYNISTNTWSCGNSGAPTPPYTTTVTSQTSVSITEATHGQGTTALAFCFDGSTPRQVVACSYTRAANGDFVFSFSPAFSGLIQIGGGGGGGGGGGVTDHAALSNLDYASSGHTGFVGGMTATNNVVIIGNGTTWTTSLIPSCSDGVASKLLYNNSTRTFSCGSDQSGSGSSYTAGPSGAIVIASNEIDIDTNVVCRKGDSCVHTGLMDLSTASNLLIKEGTPASAGASCTKGTILYDASYLYTCVATNTWRRAAHATW